jgi:hypothetical protein
MLRAWYPKRWAAQCALALALAAVCACAEEPELANPALRVAFTADTGQLAACTELHGEHDFVGAPNAASGLWEISFLNEDAPPLTPFQAQSFSWSRLESATPAIELIWQDFALDRAPGLRVTVTAALDASEPVSRWRIRIESLGELLLDRVRFPRIHHVTPQEREALAAPVWMGERTERFRELLSGPKGETRRFEWEYPGTLSLQCLTVYRENGPGLYLASNDTAALRKHFAAFGDGQGGVGVEVIQFPAGGVAQGQAYASPYDVILGAFEGDWLTAAERYRAWALDQSWARQSRLRQGQVPEWVLNTGLWAWNRGRSENVLGPAAILQEKAGLPVSVFWHWWHGCSYDTGFPEYLPPREGEEAFRQALDAAHGQGLHALVYMNQRLWGMTTKSWAEKNAEAYAVKSRDGKVHPEVYNTFTKAPCASMCMGTPFWRNTYAEIANLAFHGLRVDGIYMDQACSSLACYDPNHGHPLGGGAYWMEGFQLLAADIRRRCADPQPIALAGEGCGEAWLPHLDLMLSLQVSMERYAAPGEWEPIPFFHAVYHGYAVFYGNYSSLTMPPYDELWPAETAPKTPLALLDRAFSTQFCLEQARAFVWGQQPTIANFRPEHFDTRPEEMAFVLQLAQLRQQARKYLLDGTLLRPPAFEVPTAEIQMSRLSIYAGQQGALRTFQKTCPLVLSAAWRAPDGAIAAALVNIADTTHKVTLTIPASWALPAAAKVHRLDATGRRPLDTLQAGLPNIEVSLPPRTAHLYEFE